MTANKGAASYSIGLADGEVVLRLDCDDVIVNLSLSGHAARRMATLLLAACDIVEADDVDDVIARHGGIS
jgi:hypothetical protein